MKKVVHYTVYVDEKSLVNLTKKITKSGLNSSVGVEKTPNGFISCFYIPTDVLPKFKMEYDKVCTKFSPKILQPTKTELKGANLIKFDANLRGLVVSRPEIFKFYYEVIRLIDKYNGDVLYNIVDLGFLFGILQKCSLAMFKFIWEDFDFRNKFVKAYYDIEYTDDFNLETQTFWSQFFKSASWYDLKSDATYTDKCLAFMKLEKLCIPGEYFLDSTEQNNVIFCELIHFICDMPHYNNHTEFESCVDKIVFDAGKFDKQIVAYINKNRDDFQYVVDSLSDIQEESNGPLLMEYTDSVVNSMLSIPDLFVYFIFATSNLMNRRRMPGLKSVPHSFYDDELFMTDLYNFTQYNQRINRVFYFFCNTLLSSLTFNQYKLSLVSISDEFVETVCYYYIVYRVWQSKRNHHSRTYGLTMKDFLHDSKRVQSIIIKLEAFMTQASNRRDGSFMKHFGDFF